jgi:hypothetical protein
MNNYERIFFTGHDTGKFPNGRIELKITFSDNKVRPYSEISNNRYIWTPKWSDLHLIINLAYEVERLNKGNHFKPFIDVADNILSHYKNYIENHTPDYDEWGFNK